VRLGGALLVMLAVLAGGCGPTNQEVGQAVLWAAPLITLVGMAIAWGYAALWRALSPGLRLDVRPGLVVAAVQSAVALATLIAPEIEPDLILVAIHLVGTSAMAAAILGLRLSVYRSARSYSWAWLAPWIVLYPPALILALMGDAAGSGGDLALYIWILPGYGGVVTGPIALLALVEVLVRRARARRSAPARWAG
jgi:hypothetical protein